MRTARLAALAALLALAGCNLTLDPDAVTPKVAGKQTLRGACAVSATGGRHQACGGLVTQGAGEGAATRGHRMAQVRITPGAIPEMASAKHKVVYAHVSQ